MALWDLAGKAFRVPAYQLLGGKFRDKVRLYADTDTSKDPREFARRLKERRDQGFSFLKMDLGIGLVQDKPGMITHPLGMNPTRDTANTQHMFTGVEITDRGVAAMADYVARWPRRSAWRCRWRPTTSGISA